MDFSERFFLGTTSLPVRTPNKRYLGVSRSSPHCARKGVLQLLRLTSRPCPACVSQITDDSQSIAK